MGYRKQSERNTRDCGAGANGTAHPVREDERMNDPVEHRAIKQWWAGVYNRGAPTYGRVMFFAHGGRRLVELARFPSSAYVLDVGTGRGANLFPAAEKAGPSGRVIGVDLAEEMVTATKAEVEQRRIGNVEVRQMDAERLEFPHASFDRVLCGFVLYFLPQVHHAFAGFARVLKPGGVLAITGPNGNPGAGSGANSPVWELLPAFLRRSAKARALVEEQRELYQRAEGMTWPERQAAGALSFPGAEELEEVLDQAGFTDVQVITEEAEIIAEDEEEWWTWQWSHMPRSALEQLEPELLAELKAAVFERLQSHKGPDGIRERFRYLFTLATKPDETT